MSDIRRTTGSRTLQDLATDTFRNATAWLRDYITAIKAGQIHQFTAMERRVREATRRDPWGPTGKQLNELVEASHNPTDCEIIFAVLHFRFGYPPEKWRNVYKALVVLDFLVQRGSDQSVQLAKEDNLNKLTDLEGFTSVGSDGTDNGRNVRYRAKAVRELLLDIDRLATVRAGHQKKPLAIQGYSRNQMTASRPFPNDQEISPGNPGETKGVTKEMAEKNRVEVKRLLDLPHNRYCADCTHEKGAARAEWASINIGVFLCLQCSGVHRSLGTDISQVRSVDFDTFLPEQVAFMAQTGNDAANKYYEARLSPDSKPSHGSAGIAAFIRRKYERLEFASDGVWPPALVRPTEDDSAESSEDLVHSESLGAQPCATDAAQRVRPSSSPTLSEFLFGNDKIPQRLDSLSTRRVVTIPLPRPSSAERVAPPEPSSQQQPLNLMDTLMVINESPEPSEGQSAENDIFASLATLEPAFSQQPTSEFDRSYPSMHCVGSSSQLGATTYTADYQNSMPEAGPDIMGQPTAALSLDFAEESVSDWNWPPASYELSSVPMRNRIGESGQPVPAPLSNSMADSSQAVPDYQGSSAAAASHSNDSSPNRGTLRLPKVSPSSISRRSSAAECDINSAASSPMSLQLSQLLGPGPSGWQTPKVKPPAVPYRPYAASARSLNGTALEQSANMWKANAEQGKDGGMDELVLRALAQLPPHPHSDIRRALSQAPASMAQQRAAVLY